MTLCRMGVGKTATSLGHNSAVPTLNRCLREATFPTLWQSWAKADPGIIDEQDILDLRPSLDDLVVTHVDKLPTEGVIL